MTHRRGARPCHQVCRGHGPSPALPPSRGSQEVASEPTSAAAGAELGCRTDAVPSLPLHGGPEQPDRPARQLWWALLASPGGTRRGGARASLSVTPQEQRPL